MVIEKITIFSISAVIVGVASNIIANLVSIPITSYFDKKKKKLVFEELQNLSVVDVKKDFKDKIEIKYAGELVDTLYVSTATLKNKGKVPIKKSEIIKPIKIIFDKKILDCNTIEVNPKGIKVTPNINFKDNSVECEFDLLNPGDYFTLQFVSLEKLDTPEIISRIEGLSKICITESVYQTDSRSQKHMHFYFGFKSTFLLSVIAFIFIAFVSPETADKILYILSWLL